MDAEVPQTTRTLIGLNLRRAGSTKDAGHLHHHIASGEP